MSYNYLTFEGMAKVKAYQLLMDATTSVFELHSIRNKFTHDPNITSDAFTACYDYYVKRKAELIEVWIKERS